ncbi:hypothetical protein [Streptococcus oralis]|uniref:Uncharacterized protein n=1 Tax=Streptococcus oralis TaxID=1303 RepID=A0AAW7W9E3_STROR|nr:hypothetical protein [Streptococcus oralis]MDO6344638.1 hypothetical protein [Streptococcus oralis]MDO6348597.1 hypothetical protein [Streptococcus oralis]MDO6350555.1 hypothetical protein [Streptococcus oralis]
MIDKDQIIKAKQEKIERIEQLQEELHKLSMLGLVTIKFLDLPDELKISMNTIHDISHVLKDVLNGMSPKEAIKQNMTEDYEEEE